MRNRRSNREKNRFRFRLDRAATSLRASTSLQSRIREIILIFLRIAGGTA
jgi:hypothetical protein